MPLTREFKETIMLRATQDSSYRQELLIEAVNAFLEADITTGKTLLKNYINATKALPFIAKELNQNEKSILRMIGPSGNLTLKNFLNILKVCKKRENLELKVH